MVTYPSKLNPIVPIISKFSPLQPLTNSLKIIASITEPQMIKQLKNLLLMTTHQKQLKKKKLLQRSLKLKNLQLLKKQ